MTDKKPKPNREPNAEIENLKQQIAELTDGLQRERADAMNVRRRSEEEKSKMANYHKVLVVRELLSFVDNFERALKYAPTKQEPKAKYELWDDWYKGLENVRKQLFQALENLGVEKIKTVGEPFDPKLHEAIQMDDSGNGPREVVTEEFMAGYRLGDEIIRHAMVKVRME